MKYVKIDPPGTFCFYDAVLDTIEKTGVPRDALFLEIGCGAGDLSKMLCDHGFSGVGLDFSPQAIEIARKNLNEYIESGKYQLISGDVMDDSVIDKLDHKVDFAMSMMVMEHVEDDLGFIRNISKLVKKGGHILLAVPGRKDRWGFEDETVGHLRRYDKSDLEETMEKADLGRVTVRSIAVPVGNVLFKVGEFLVKFSNEKHKVEQSLREQTETSGIREIPFKTVFPSFFKLILNKVTLYPLFVLQRLFYHTNLGLTMLGIGKVKE